uniref:Monoacylglycerol O-acyltransferase 3 n=2 Tax=Melopsittacus undulatus TaxID=13146 RepID=A0A8V5GS21_MELUD
MCLHPHGVLSVSAFGNFAIDASGFGVLFPGLRVWLLTLPAWFRVPLLREYLLAGGLVSSDRRSLDYLLSRPGGGHVAAIVVGGAPEALEAEPGALRMRIRHRTGFVRCALHHGASLVPVFSFGENELFHQRRPPPGSALRMLQERVLRMLGLALPLFHARGVFQYDLGLLPFRRAVCSVVGRPLQLPRVPNPPPEAVSLWHIRYLRRLQELFERHKEEFGIPKERHLHFL